MIINTFIRKMTSSIKQQRHTYLMQKKNIIATFARIEICNCTKWRISTGKNLSGKVFAASVVFAKTKCRFELKHNSRFQQFGSNFNHSEKGGRKTTERLQKIIFVTELAATWWVASTLKLNS